MIIQKNPDLFLVPSHLSYKIDGNCWFNEDNSLDSITILNYLKKIIVQECIGCHIILNKKLLIVTYLYQFIH